jgi:predicted RNA-binding Zn-ribbon protein involved in translation (DUF1610 family)
MTIDRISRFTCNSCGVTGELRQAEVPPMDWASVIFDVFAKRRFVSHWCPRCADTLTCEDGFRVASPEADQIVIEMPTNLRRN